MLTSELSTRGGTSDAAQTRRSSPEPNGLLGRWLVFLRNLDLEDRPARVVAAVRAGVVAALWLVAVRALLQLGQRERLVGASVTLSSVGDPALGHAHESRCSFRCSAASWRRSRACVSARLSMGTSAQSSRSPHLRRPGTPAALRAWGRSHPRRARRD